MDTQRRDKDFRQMIGQIKEVEEILSSTERERKKQQEAIFGVMKMINIAGGLIPDQKDVEIQTDLTISTKYANIFTEVPLTQIQLQSTSLIHKMASLTFENQRAESANPAKGNKKRHQREQNDVSSVSVDETFRFISKVFTEKHKKDQLTRKNLTPNFSLDQFTVQTILEENSTKLQDAVEILVSHFKNISKELKVNPSPTVEFIARMFGVCGRLKVPQDTSDYLLQIFKDLATSPG